MTKLTIVIVAFNRPKSLNRLLNSLNNLIILKGETIDLHISIDRRENDENNALTINVANKFTWDFGKKIVDVKKENYGLKKHVLYCGNLTNQYENIIVLEDDIVVSPLIVQYAKQAIEFYSDDSKIAGIGLYSFQRNQLNNYPFYPLNNGSDVYFMQYACSWGQLWTKDKWSKFYEWYEKNKNIDFSNFSEIPNYIKNWGDKSWLKYHMFYCILNDKYFVYPQNGLTTNFTDVGTHNKESNNAYQCNMYLNDINFKFKFTKIDDALNIYDAFFENVKLDKILKCDRKIESNVYGGKSKFNNNNLLLSTKNYDYKIISSYGLKMYPIEYNLYYDIEGNDLFLYDMSKIEKNKLKHDEYNLFKYSFKLQSVSSRNRVMVIKKFLKYLFSKIIHR